MYLLTKSFHDEVGRFCQGPSASIKRTNKAHEIKVACGLAGI